MGGSAAIREHYGLGEGAPAYRHAFGEGACLLTSPNSPNASGLMCFLARLLPAPRLHRGRAPGLRQDHQAQLDALAVAHCREIVVETASTRDARPKLASALAALHPGDTLVIYKPDRVARSMKELHVAGKAARNCP